MKRIWILSELYFPEQTSTGHILTKIAEGLAEEYEVKVITGAATNFLIREKRPKYEVRYGVEIFRCQGTAFNKNFFWGRIVNLITGSTSILWKALQACKYGEIILVVTNPPLLPFVALILRWLKKYNQMAAGKPIIAVADDWSELAEVVREEEIGWIVKPGDIQGLVNTIKFASDHPELCLQMGVKAAKVASSKYTFTQTDQAYKKLFKEI
ncbi:hypothetical protein BMF77_01254 [Dolichospermum sp. UHCC 0315A]|uniref:glycosyltransferase n=1 Tax=Dolichospermum sp. UHCC 0315A TaxID=1914871 RepID=UPI0011E8A029|nr:glycosyltransferase family 4 protein [Dolichospermum sp. UHCC 0315A]QEI40682.1 hypothetical protein BMF77_01254 [Dolichospermum sp. UHCC 0315A]